MKILRILLPLFFLSFSSLLAQESRVFDALTVDSKILGMERKFAVYLPPGYEYSQRSYPVLYLLHGAGDDQTGWVQFGEVQRIADNAFEDGTATPMIIVMPDANTGKRGYFNDIKNEWRYEDFFFEELMPYVESQYRIKREKKYRAISGLSMGGGGTYFYAMHRPELFSSACPLSASLRNTAYDDFLKRFESEVKDKDQLRAYYDKHQALRQLEVNDIEKIKSVKWFFDCGDDDFLYEGNSLVHIAMKKMEIPHEFRIRDGAHNWTYWRESLPNVLAFVSDTFHQK
ncbi:alpha/beta hydrolase [Cyclobacterium marinum]|uniref:Esterase n=1 Tax=Cyclobacterium marinum (strain ATCC 25205 / DSM 745 / LMG 13164 / NCIMB 1802) TaxID=880070 RepID=G0IVP0_CYCMS|nr:alpha/beta hydrolase-fold protein [Cyclobacterium marinum]AEL24807.1 esterase [Cyclobacterium marinum DSM 745]MBR9774720.1 esterase family protein [Cytophagales bacterium]|tara:strand:+ start:24860 stop:25717 length:858 start_codon:yes stop_codon:yes gene_type:complete